jgi:formylmethanofuran dehydrogenase subunit E
MKQSWYQDKHDEALLKLKREAPECSNCGERSSEDTLTLYNCGGFYLCNDCYEKNQQATHEGM